MIDPKLIQQAGSDWAGYGELTGPQLLGLAQTDKLRVVFANDYVLVAVQRPDGVWGVYNLKHTPIQVAQSSQELFTSTQIAQATGCSLANVEKSWPVLSRVMASYNLATPANIVGIVGTVAVETGAFLPVREAFYLYSQDPVEAERLFQLNPTPAYDWYNDTTRHAAYEGGPQYHGRGFVQTTHLSNYKRVQDKTGLPVVSNPDLLLQAEPAAHAICIYWQDRGLASVCEVKDWAEVRRRVYGGTDDAGTARIARVAQVLGVV